MIQCPQCCCRDYIEKINTVGDDNHATHHCSNCNHSFIAAGVGSIYERTIECWGIDNQLSQAQEELAELIVAINHYRRLGCKANGAWEHVCGEIADVEIMIEQLKVILGTAAHAKIHTVRMLKLSNITKMLEGK